MPARTAATTEGRPSRFARAIVFRPTFRRRRDQPRERAHDLPLALALQPGEAEDFAAVQLERDAGPAAAGDEAGDGERDGRTAPAPRAAAETIAKARVPPSATRGGRASELGRRRGRHVAAVLQHRRRVAEAEDLVEPVADVEDQLARPLLRVDQT